MKNTLLCLSLAALVAVASTACEDKMEGCHKDLCITGSYFMSQCKKTCNQCVLTEEEKLQQEKAKQKEMRQKAKEEMRKEVLRKEKENELNEKLRILKASSGTVQQMDEVLTKEMNEMFLKERAERLTGKYYRNNKPSQLEIMDDKSICEDAYSLRKCIAWTNGGEVNCDDDERSVLKVCRKTCKACKGDLKRRLANEARLLKIYYNKTRCEDILDNCKSQTNGGTQRCDILNLRKYCRKTCNACKGGTNEIINERNNQEKLTLKARLEILHDKTRCEDAYDQRTCQSAIRWYCNWDKKQSCRKTCKACEGEFNEISIGRSIVRIDEGVDSKEEAKRRRMDEILYDKSRCEDAQSTENCKGWTKNGRNCDGNMKNLCRKTCKACKGGGNGGRD